MIDIIFGPAPAEEVPAIEVSSYPSPLDGASSLSRVCLYHRDGTGLKITELSPGRRLCLDEAIEEACTEAENRGHQRVYVDSSIALPRLELRCVAKGPRGPA